MFTDTIIYFKTATFDSHPVLTITKIGLTLHFYIESCFPDKPFTVSGN